MPTTFRNIWTFCLPSSFHCTYKYNILVWNRRRSMDSANCSHLFLSVIRLDKTLFVLLVLLLLNLISYLHVHYSFGFIIGSLQTGNANSFRVTQSSLKLLVYYILFWILEASLARSLSDCRMWLDVSTFAGPPPLKPYIPTEKPTCSNEQALKAILLLQNLQNFLHHLKIKFEFIIHIELLFLPFSSELDTISWFRTSSSQYRCLLVLIHWSHFLADSWK